MQFVKSLFFNITFYLTITFFFIVALPTLILPGKAAAFVGKLLAYKIIILMKVFLNSKVIFHGLENLKKKEKFFVACAHQSMLETFILQAPLNYPIFILKKELLKIPLFGLYLKKIGAIDIVRETTTKKNINFFEKIKERVSATNRPLLIFPQGTRIKFGEKVPFKKGVGRIYSSLNIPCIPVALNSGKIWPKNSFLKFPGDLHISFLEPINEGKEKKDFVRELENKIYDEMEKFN